MKKTLVSASYCGPCFALKKRIEKEKLKVDIIEFDTEEDESKVKKVKEWGIKAVPRLVVEDGDSVELIQGSDDIIEKIKEE